MAALVGEFGASSPVRAIASELRKLGLVSCVGGVKDGCEKMKTLGRVALARDTSPDLVDLVSDELLSAEGEFACAPGEPDSDPGETPGAPGGALSDPLLAGPSPRDGD